MNSNNIDHWQIEEGKTGLLLFAQTMEELLSIRSHDSHKVPVLNFHFLCVEILSVIELIENDVIDSGNLYPLFDEMRIMFNDDIVAQQILGNCFDDIFFKKTAKGEYDKTPIILNGKKDIDTFLPRLKKTTMYIIAELGRNNCYYTGLKDFLKTQILSYNVASNGFLIYKLTRIIASELINKGFNQHYIYNCIKRYFFDSERIVASVDVLDEFFSVFPFENKNFIVYLPLKSDRQKKAFESYGKFDFDENSNGMFAPDIPYILIYDCDAKDPYRAREIALNMINFSMSINHFIKHNKYDYNPEYSKVVDVTSGITYSIKRPKRAIECSSGNVDILQAKDLVNMCLNLDRKMAQVFQLHSNALKSQNIENQLINLWTTIEVAIPVSRKDDLSRINQISNVLCSVLSNNYYFDLIHRLYLDISDTYEEIQSLIDGVASNVSVEEKLVLIITLDKNEEVFQNIIELLEDSFPLLVCRLQHYKGMLSTSEKILESYRKHSIRLSHQIMRIYRTRNMLVHDGSYFPYMNSVFQNLHYYIDSYVSFIYFYFENGYRSIESVINAVHLKEMKYLSRLKLKEPLSEENISKLIFNV